MMRNNLNGEKKMDRFNGDQRDGEILDTQTQSRIVGVYGDEYRDEILALLNRKDESTLPIQDPCCSCYTVQLDHGGHPEVGMVWSSGQEGSCLLGEIGSAIKTIEIRHFFLEVGGSRITAFHWLGKNPLNMPEWNAIPEPPECLTFRFQIYARGTWLDMTVKNSCYQPNSYSYTSPNAVYMGGADKRMFWDSVKSWCVEKFIWKDPCPELGEWPGSEEVEEDSKELKEEPLLAPTCNADIMLTLSNGESVKGWYTRMTDRYQRYLKDHEVVSWRPLTESEL